MGKEKIEDMVTKSIKENAHLFNRLMKIGIGILSEHRTRWETNKSEEEKIDEHLEGEYLFPAEKEFAKFLYDYFYDGTFEIMDPRQELTVFGLGFYKDLILNIIYKTDFECVARWILDQSYRYYEKTV